MTDREERDQTFAAMVDHIERLHQLVLKIRNDEGGRVIVHSSGGYYCWERGIYLTWGGDGD